jgi:rare lipoprotein A
MRQFPFLTVLKILAVTAAVFTLSACSTTSSLPGNRDAAPGGRIDVSKIQDAVPRHVRPSRYGNPSSYKVYGKRYHVLKTSKGYRQQGTASWYGTKFHGRRTSSGEAYDMYKMTAAHKTLPIPSYARVTHLQTGKSIVVRINDRGPFVNNRLIDLSYVAAHKLGIVKRGTGPVEVEVITPDDLKQPATPTTQLVDNGVVPIDSTHQPVQSKPLYLQVGVFTLRENAERLRQDLLDLPLPGIHVISDSQQSEPRYRVRIGPIHEQSEADQLIKLLADNGHHGFRSSDY